MSVAVGVTASGGSVIICSSGMMSLSNEAGSTAYVVLD